MQFKIKLSIPGIAAILLIAGLAPACHRTHPYPPLKKQREDMAKKKPVPPVRVLDSTAIVSDLIFLSSDSCEGRAPGTPGHQLALERIIRRMRHTGVDSFEGSLEKGFKEWYHNNRIQGSNVAGFIKGSSEPDSVILISAHYDHVGKIGDSIYYGASDNACGVACLLALADHFKKYPSPYTLVFAAFDMEEAGMKGSAQFLQYLPRPLNTGRIKLNINIDMIARSDKHELFACGIEHYPQLRYLVDEIQPTTNTKLLMGHDWGDGRDDWTYLSDHYPFHLNKIPFIYFGTEDHPDYHRPTDTWDKIDLDEFIENCNLVMTVIRHVR